MISHNINQNLVNLSTAERNQLFQLCTNHAALLAKIIPNIPLLEYISTGTAVGADDNAIIQQYIVWKNNNT
jgi:hypothetical protein